MAWQKKYVAESEKSADLKKAHARAMWYLSQRDHAAQELYEKICRYFTPEAAASAVAQMVECEYVNDERYAQNKAKSLLYAHKSRREIAQKLTQKGVERTLVASVLDALYAQEDAPIYGALCDEPEDAPDLETEAAMALITRRYARKREQGREDLVIAALMRRGFSYRTAREALMRTACVCDESL